MYSFRTNNDIFKYATETWDENWLDKETINYPPIIHWDYSRDLKVEDVELWEVIYEESGARGVYASYMPYAEFYMIRLGWQVEQKGYGVETYYGKGAMDKVVKRMKELNWPFATNNIWVDEDHMNLFF